MQVGLDGAERSIQEMGDVGQRKVGKEPECDHLAIGLIERRHGLSHGRRTLPLPSGSDDGSGSGSGGNSGPGGGDG